MLFELFLNILGQEDVLYVARFSKQLRIVARQLRREGHVVWARLDRTEQCVELRSLFGFGDLFARVSVHRIHEMPFKAVVTSPKPIPASSQLLFERTLPLVVEFKVKD